MPSSAASDPSTPEQPTTLTAVSRRSDARSSSSPVSPYSASSSSSASASSSINRSRQGHAAASPARVPSTRRTNGKAWVGSTGHIGRRREHKWACGGARRRSGPAATKKYHAPTKAGQFARRREVRCSSGARSAGEPTTHSPASSSVRSPRRPSTPHTDDTAKSSAALPGAPRRVRRLCGPGGCSGCSNAAKPAVWHAVVAAAVTATARPPPVGPYCARPIPAVSDRSACDEK